jgi:SpoVK/Ycf46/Vps4 family AAA+-type ATPase
MFRSGPTTIAAFGAVLEPTEAVEPILARGVRDALTEWLTEIWAKDDLEGVGLAPRKRALFDGPPGVGKTTLAHHLAARLGLAMVAVCPERIIDCWVGSSAQNLGALFDCASAGDPVVIFFDEFESLAGARVDQRQSADAHYNEMVNTLLQRIEAHEGFIIAATNKGSQIDQAIWRRFDVQIRLDMPGQFERERIIARYISPFIISPESLKRLGEACETATPALMRQLCEALKRNIVIGPRVGWNMQREAVIERIIAAIQPHPELGKPRLWTMGAKDMSIRWLEWPLARHDEAREAA